MTDRKEEKQILGKTGNPGKISGREKFTGGFIIMAINLKAKETLIQVGEQKGNYRYVLGTDLYSKLTESKVIQEAALRSGVSRGVMQACWDAAGNVIMAWATEGHSVAIPGLGTMRFGVRAKSVSNVAEVASSLITSRRVIFTPNVEIKNELQRTAIQITCYDRNGKLVKKVTSGDKGDVEDPDKEPNGSEGDNKGDAGSNGDNKGDTGQDGDNKGDTGSEGDNKGDTGQDGDGDYELK